MARLVLALVGTVVLSTGCMRLHEVAGDGQGGAYMLAQRHFLGIGGAQTLVHCARPVSGPAQCKTVVDTRSIAGLPPADYPPQSSGSFLENDVWGSLDGLMGELGEYYGEGDGSIGGLASTDGPVPDCPAGAIAEDTVIPDGTSVTLLLLHPDDAYYGSEGDDRLPLQGVVTGDLHRNESCWLGGGFETPDGQSFYFYKAAFRLN